MRALPILQLLWWLFIAYSEVEETLFGVSAAPSVFLQPSTDPWENARRLTKNLECDFDRLVHFANESAACQ